MSKNTRPKTPVSNLVQLEKITGVTGDVGQSPALSGCTSFMSSFEVESCAPTTFSLYKDTSTTLRTDAEDAKSEDCRETPKAVNASEGQFFLP
jgi:hypothetical protein